MPNQSENHKKKYIVEFSMKNKEYGFILWNLNADLPVHNTTEFSGVTRDIKFSSLEDKHNSCPKDLGYAFLNGSLGKLEA